MSKDNGISDERGIQPIQQQVPRHQRRRILVTILGIVLVLSCISIWLSSSVKLDAYYYSDDGIAAMDNIKNLSDAPALLRDINHYHITSHNNLIRRWGCSNTETPFIFVHIGKAGGGTVRRRIAFSAHNVTRQLKEWKQSHLDNHYYPITKTSSLSGGRKEAASNKVKSAYFCNSKYKNHRLPNSTKYSKTYEGNLACYATTPIGMALACPETTFLEEEESKQPTGCKGCDYLDSDNDQCNIVYVGHNVLGNELHFLPPKYLHKWWTWSNFLGDNDENSSANDHQQISDYFIKLQELDSNPNNWCHPYYDISRSKVLRANHINSKYTNCSKILSPVLDTLFNQFWKKRYSASTRSNSIVNNYAPIYASLPLHRTTLLREPFSWLLSKLFWYNEEWDSHRSRPPPKGFATSMGHRNRPTLDQLRNRGKQQQQQNSLHRGRPKCDDIDVAIFGYHDVNDDKSNRTRSTGIVTGGWVTDYCVEYILYLCGDDCVSRYDYLLVKSDNTDTENMETTFLKQIELQAITNLRHSFSVVGLLHETDQFLQMISKRIQYINTSLSNNGIQQHKILNDISGRHEQSRITPERKRCYQLYNHNTTFQSSLKQKSVCLQSLERIYDVGVAVNRFQQQELSQCR